MRKFALVLLLGLICVPAAMTHGVTAQTATPGPPPPPPLYTPPPIVPPPAPAPPTSTPAPSPTATTVPTATAVPLSISVHLAHSTVAPGKKQKVSVSTLAGAAVSLTVTFPNKYKRSHDATANSAGTASWSFVQPGNRITHTSRSAKVAVQVSSGGLSLHTSKHYTIGFGPIDATVQPHKQKPGEGVTIWIHTAPFVSVTVTFRSGGRIIRTLPVRSGGDGWLQIRYIIPAHTARGKIQITAAARLSTGTVATTTSFTVK